MNTHANARNDVSGSIASDGSGNPVRGRPLVYVIATLSVSALVAGFVFFVRHLYGGGMRSDTSPATRAAFFVTGLFQGLANPIVISMLYLATCLMVWRASRFGSTHEAARAGFHILVAWLLYASVVAVMGNFAASLHTSSPGFLAPN